MSDFGVGTEEALGAIIEGKNVFITGPGGCVDSETEYLSKDGWKKIKDYAGEEILIVDSGLNSFFSLPEEFHKYPCEKFLSFQGMNVDQVLSEEHRVIYESLGSKYKGKKYPNTLKEISAKDLSSRFFKSKKGLSARLIPIFNNIGGMGIDMTEGELRLQVAVMADGRIVKEGKDNYTQMRFSKKRKYDRLLWLCQSFGLPYKDNGCKENPKYSNNVEYEVIVWPKTDEKEFTGRFYDCTKQQLKIILDEVMHWDGCVSDNCLVSTNSKKTADFIQFAAAGEGIRCSIKEDSRSENVNYVVRKSRLKRVSLPKNGHGEVRVTELPSRDGLKYCFTTETGMWVMRRGNKICVTGNSGKSHLIKTIQSLYPSSTLTVAPTGVASLNVDGMTTHRAFGLSMGIATEDDGKTVKTKPKKLLKSKSLERIIIDEISMVRADKLWEMDQKLRVARREPKKAFGGLQVIMFGDFFQNPPVLTDSEENAYFELHSTELSCFSDTWGEINPYPVLLDKIYRQNSVHFSSLLNHMRKGERIDEIVKFLNNQCYSKGAALNAITLTSTNAAAERINKKHYDQIPGEEVIYKASKTGDFAQRPVAESLHLKVGTRVMITVNDQNPDEDGPKFVNGSRGIIKALRKFSVDVELEDGKVVEIEKNVWENVEYFPRKVIKNGKTEEELEKIVVGTYTNLPIRLGYAVTIHKAQGLTLPEVNIDFGYGAFAPGMAYVAFSRATSTKGLRLLRPVKERDIIVDQRIVKFYKDTFPGKF